MACSWPACRLSWPACRLQPLLAGLQAGQPSGGFFLGRGQVIEPTVGLFLAGLQAVQPSGGFLLGRGQVIEPTVGLFLAGLQALLSGLQAVLAGLQAIQPSGGFLLGCGQLGNGFGELEQFPGEDASAHLFQEFRVLVELPDEGVGSGGGHGSLSLLSSRAVLSDGSMTSCGSLGEAAGGIVAADWVGCWLRLIRHFKMRHYPARHLN